MPHKFDAAFDGTAAMAAMSIPMWLADVELWGGGVGDPGWCAVAGAAHRDCVAGFAAGASFLVSLLIRSFFEDRPRKRLFCCVLWARIIRHLTPERIQSC